MQLGFIQGSMPVTLETKQERKINEDQQIATMLSSKAGCFDEIRYLVASNSDLRKAENCATKWKSSGEINRRFKGTWAHMCARDVDKVIFNHSNGIF